MSAQPRRAPLVAGAIAALVMSLAVPAAASAPRGPSAPLEYLGDTTIPAGMPFDGTVVGGLSSITYDASRGVYYALSDDQGAGFTPTSTPSRFYTLHVDVSDGSLDAGDVTVLSTTTLLGLDGHPFPAQSLDPEGMTLTPQHTLVVTSEGISNRGIPPFVREFSVSGQELRDLPVPGYFDPTDPSVGVRNNLGFEAAAVTPDGQRLVVGTENALVQDGPAATTSTTSPARVLSYHLGHGGSDREYVYDTDPVVAPSSVFTVNGLVELLPLNQQFMLAMERSFSVGVGNDIRIYQVALPGATNVSGVPDLEDVGDLRPAQKSLLLHLPATVGGQPLDNVEGMTLGPLLPDGRRAVLMVSDNNFTPGQDSQVLLAALG
ncbi:MAG TPA: esterase-like activity of phytase family protein [Actinomycetes bacterium]|nr:esterase-like activity of phytase family protein [Actinomycetes bacterium]